MNSYIGANQHLLQLQQIKISIMSNQQDLITFFFKDIHYYIIRNREHVGDNIGVTSIHSTPSSDVDMTFTFGKTSLQRYSVDVVERKMDVHSRSRVNQSPKKYYHMGQKKNVLTKSRPKEKWYRQLSPRGVMLQHWSTSY